MLSINQNFIYTIYYNIIFLVNIILNLQTDGAGTPEIVEPNKLNKLGIPVTMHSFKQI